MQTWQSCVDSVADGPEGAADEETRKQAVEKCSAVVSASKQSTAQHQYRPKQPKSLATAVCACRTIGCVLG
jgi:hypothetical protein